MDPITGYLLKLLIGVVLSVGATLLQQAFAPKQQRATGTRGSTLLGGRVPKYFLVGTVGEPGKREYRNAWGTAGGVPNAYNVDVYSFGDLPITSLARLFVNGVIEPISGSGHVTQGYPSTGDKAGYFWAEFFDGTQTDVSSYLTGKFGADADRPWTSDMIGRGVPYLIATALWNEKRWTGFPEIVGEFQGIPLYDPRLDDEAGGAGDQRWDDQSTWAFSDNNMVIIYNIERGIYYDGAQVWGGSATAAQLPYDVWAAAMDACDEDVDLEAGGTEKRFRAGRRINLNERPGDVIKELLIGSNARISHASDGTVYILVGVPDEADGVFTDADVLATEPLGSIPWPNLDDTINGAAATYREPSQAWEDKETAPYLRSDLVDEDDGRENVEGLDLGTTFSGTQAQRILKAVIEEGRRFGRHVVVLPPEFARYRPLSTLAWTSERFDYDQKLFLVTARTRDPWGKVILGLQEVDAADHGWTPETDERPLSFAPVVINRPPAQEVSGEFVEPAIGKDEDGADRRAGYRVHWSSTSVAVDVDFVRITHRLAGETVNRWRGLVPRPELLLGEAEVYEALLPSQTFEVQIEYLPPSGSGRETVASDWMEVTTPPVQEIPPLEPSMLGTQLAAERGLLVDDGPGSLAELIDTFLTKLDEVAGALTTNNMVTTIVRDLVSARFGSASAAVLSERVARVTADSALASQIEEVVAQLPDAIASGYLKLEAEVEEEGAEVNIMAKGRVEVGGVTSQAAWLVHVSVVEGIPEAYMAIYGGLRVIDTVSGIITEVLKVEGGKIRFNRWQSVAEVSGTPIFDFNGATGAFSITVP